jgi:folate-binding protein YgfZ
MTSDSLQGATPLPSLGVVRAFGPDAATFLHNQLTNDIAGLDSAAARLAGYCSPKGRLLASFVVWRRGIDEWLLACSADLLAPTLKRLSMFVLRARCQLSDATPQVELRGLAGESALGWLGHGAPRKPWQRSDIGHAQVIRLPDAEGVARFLWAAPAGEPAPPLPALALDAWDWLEVRAGVPRIVAATADRFVPQMVNLELVGGLDFQKGCYPGQEVVARSQYRGTVKRRAFLFDADAPLAPGAEVFAAGDEQPAGMVVNAASHGGRHSALVELKLAALDAELRAADGAALRSAPLPYALPAEAG